VTFAVTNTVVEVVTYTATDTTGPVVVTATAQVNFTAPAGGATITGLTVASGLPYVVVSAPPGLQVNDEVYIDRSYFFTGVPALGLLQGQAYIQTANADKQNTTPSFLSFTVDQPVTVYVAHDSRITTKPAWLSTWTDTGQDLGLTGHATPFDLFAQDFPAGLVTLGGNGGNGGSSMYSVIVKPQ
jgi:rhamnogalacturonan endolyase